MARGEELEGRPDMKFSFARRPVDFVLADAGADADADAVGCCAAAIAAFCMVDKARAWRFLILILVLLRTSDCSSLGSHVRRCSTLEAGSCRCSQIDYRLGFDMRLLEFEPAGSR